MSHLYPAIKPYNEFYLNVSTIHTIFVEESGNKNGIPVNVFSSMTKPESSKFINALELELFG